MGSFLTTEASTEEPDLNKSPSSTSRSPKSVSETVSKSVSKPISNKTVTKPISKKFVDSSSKPSSMKAAFKNEESVKKSIAARPKKVPVSPRKQASKRSKKTPTKKTIDSKVSTVKKVAPSTSRKRTQPKSDKSTVSSVKKIKISDKDIQTTPSKPTSIKPVPAPKTVSKPISTSVKSAQDKIPKVGEKKVQSVKKPASSNITIARSPRTRARK